jgi:F-type H+-transporting ATPase subunit delta
MAAVSSRYARAFADVVIDLKLDVNAIQQQLHALLDIIQGSEELRNVWENPAIPAEQKHKLLDAIVARAGMVRQVRNLIAVLIDHGRIAALEHIVRQFEADINRRLGIAEADVTSARELSSEEKQALETQIQKLTGKKVRARYLTDGDLLGGAVVRLGSTIYDGSVRGQLEKLKEQLSAG